MVEEKPAGTLHDIHTHTQHACVRMQLLHKILISVLQHSELMLNTPPQNIEVSPIHLYSL